MSLEILYFFIIVYKFNFTKDSPTGYPSFGGFFHSAKIFKKLNPTTLTFSNRIKLGDYLISNIHSPLVKFLSFFIKNLISLSFFQKSKPKPTNNFFFRQLDNSFVFSSF